MTLGILEYVLDEIESIPTREIEDTSQWLVAAVQVS